ncbi:MAG: hypothetical protein KF740_07675 [Ramlibacter sp.]|nr:hypothetical protein [Ramlibacter sp.]
MKKRNTGLRMWVLGMALLGLSACGGGSNQALTAPTAVTAEGSLDGVRLSWAATAGAQAYALQRCAVPAGAGTSACASLAADACGAPVAVTTATTLDDVPPAKSPQAFCYRVRACADLAGQACGPESVAVAAAQRAPAAARQAIALIGDDGREVISGLRPVHHAARAGRQRHRQRHLALVPGRRPQGDAGQYRYARAELHRPAGDGQHAALVRAAGDR